ncbi:hypothetical protein SAMN04490240_0981 [Rhodococcus pyridinivorans]|uniref:hypothetical protein n=1 Tax=Rhodococcus TaxID=1827 RepID=UPI0007CD9CCD|nr:MULTISPECIES: hypothetical protein [Rhodococcus]MBX4171456.1 hypothetical protein [Rhodococcus sp. DMU2021]SEC04400.1 hypothetical protein SAMN04490240_0981 [Rhodococcus pyridinivorans]
MSETTPRRMSYVARILLVPLGKSGDDLVEQMARAGLTDVDVVTAHSPAEAAVRDINAEATVVRRIDELVTESDMVILIGSVLPQVPIGFATAMAEAARESGNLLAGVLIDQQDWDSPQGAEAMAVLRMELDMLVSITQVSLATAFVDVLKGGYRTPGAYAPVLSTPRI